MGSPKQTRKSINTFLSALYSRTPTSSHFRITTKSCVAATSVVHIKLSFLCQYCGHPQLRPRGSCPNGNRNTGFVMNINFCAPLINESGFISCTIYVFGIVKLNSIISVKKTWKLKRVKRDID